MSTAPRPHPRPERRAPFSASEECGWAIPETAAGRSGTRERLRGAARAVFAGKGYQVMDVAFPEMANLLLVSAPPRAGQEVRRWRGPKRNREMNTV